LNIFVSLRGRLSDQLREINFCRTRLDELVRSFQDAYRDHSAEAPGGNGHNIFPAGCLTLDEAVQQLLQTLSAEQTWELEGRVQQLVQQQFQGLTHVCLASANLLDGLQIAMQHEAEQFLEQQITGVGIADMYLAQQADDGQAEQDLADAFDL